MNLKDTKIYIPEIPKEWTNRMRSGDANIWNDPFHRNGLETVKLDPPIIGLYAERFEDGWYWVCGCNKCLENGKPYSYTVCEEHNRCVTCDTPRKEVTETPWGHPDGFQCKPCHTKEHNARKTDAIQTAKSQGHSEDNCSYTTEILCPVCSSTHSNDDMNQPGEHEAKCRVCDSKFKVEVEYEVRYTSTLN